VKLFKKLYYSLTSWRHSPSASAIAIGKLKRPLRRPVNPQEVEKWVADMVHATGGLIRQWLRQDIIVSVDRAHDLETSRPDPEVVIPIKAFFAEDPVQVMDNVTGAILHQIGGRRLVAKHDPYKGRVLQPHRCLMTVDLQKEYEDSVGTLIPLGVTFRSATETLMNVMAASLGRHETLSQWPGWDGFYSSYLALLTDKIPLLIEQIESPTVNPIIRMVSTITAKLNGIEVEGVLAPQYETIVEQILETHYKRGWKDCPKGLQDKCISIVESMITQLTAIGELGVDRAGPNCQQIHANWWGTFSRLPDLPEQGKNKGNAAEQSEQSESGQGDIEVSPSDSAEAPPEEPPPSPLNDRSMQTIKNTRVHMSVKYDPAGEVIPKSRRKTKPFELRYLNEQNVPVESYSVSYMDEIKKRSLPIQHALRNLLITVMQPPKPVYGFRSGSLDENALHSVSYDDRLFSRTPPQGEDKVEVILLLDCSGSMSGSRMESTLDCAYAISSVLGRSPRITVRIIGHSAYKEPERVTIRLKEVTKDNLIHCYASGENGDGYAIQYAAGLFNRAKRKIMILIADGQPSVVHHYTGSEALQHTAKVVQSLPNKGIEFVCIGLDRCITDTVGRYMYGQRFIQVPAAGRELPSSVGRFLRDTLSGSPR
jgi:hypothetical protein